MVHVAAGGMDEMVAADSQRIAIAHGCDHVQLGARHFDAGGKGQRAAVDGVQRVHIHITRYPGRAPDAGNHHQIPFRDLQPFDGTDQTCQHLTVPATRAPQVR